MAAASTHTPPPASVELEQFVFRPDKYTADKVPRKLTPRDVAEFVLQRLNTTANLKNVQQVEKVVVFYDALEVAEHVKRLLSEAVGEKDIRKAIILDRIVALIGQPSDTQVAAQVYEQLVPRAGSLQELDDLLRLYEALSGAVSADSLRQQSVIQRSQLVAQAGANYEAKIQAAKLEDFINIQITRVSKANNAKKDVLQIRDRRARIQDEIKSYLGTKNSYLDILQPWSAMRLRREVWADQPEQQIMRNDDPGRREELVQEFRLAANGLSSMSTLPQQSLPSIRVRVLHAVEFFGGSITPEERHYSTEHAGMQDDILSNE